MEVDQTKELFRRIHPGQCPVCGSNGDITVKFKNIEYSKLNSHGIVSRSTTLQRNVGHAICSNCHLSFAAINVSDITGIPGNIRIYPYEYLEHILSLYRNYEIPRLNLSSEDKENIL